MTMSGKEHLLKRGRGRRAILHRYLGCGDWIVEVYRKNHRDSMITMVNESAFKYPEQIKAERDE
jgi:hypothetical protein